MGTINFFKTLFSISPLFLLFAVGVFLLWAFICFSIFKKNNLGRIIGLTLFIGPIVLVHYAINPPKSFYKAHFSYLTGTQFPDNGDFIDMYATFPDLQGDYYTCGVFRAPHAFIRELSKTIPKVTENRERGIKCAKNNSPEIYPSHRERIEDEVRHIRGSWGISTENNIVYFSFFDG